MVISVLGGMRQSVSVLGGSSVTGRSSGAMPDCYVDSGFVTPEGEPIFVPAEDMNERAS